MRPLPDTAALHTEADNMPALSKDESRYMGRQVVPAGTVNPSAMAVYGEIESSVENEDQVNMHHAEPDEHL